MALKTKALSCLTPRQQFLANVLMTPAIRQLNRVARNGMQHPRTSRNFARATVRDIFNTLDLSALHPGLTIEHFYDVIDNAPPPLGGEDPRPLFLEVDDDNSPYGLQREILLLEGELNLLQAENE